MQNKNIFSSKTYDYIFCDSYEALEHFYNKGLSKKIEVISSSPYLIINKNKTDLYNNWKKSNYKKFQSSIFSFSYSIFRILSTEKKLTKEETILISIFSNNYHKFLLKIAQIKEKFLKKKILCIEIDRNYPNAAILNAPWRGISSNINFEFINYMPKKSYVNNHKASFFNRIILGGLESVKYRFLIKFSRLFNCKYIKNILILSENELVIEFVSTLFLKGFLPMKLKDPDSKGLEAFKIEASKIKILRKRLDKVLKKRISEWVHPMLIKNCMEYFFIESEKILKEHNYWIAEFRSIFCTHKYLFKKEIIAVSNHSSSQKNLAAKSVLNSNGCKVFTFQHGVTAEISGTHNYCLSQHDSSSADFYFAFNKSSFKIAKENPFGISKNFIYGAAKRYKRQKKLLKSRENYPILFLSNKLYKGNSGGLSTWSTDKEMANTEIKIMQILQKSKKQIYYKPYPQSFQRYVDPDPCDEILKKQNKLNIIKSNYDARYMISRAQLVICCSATSTLSWVIMSNIPLIFINFSYIAPLKKEVELVLEKGIFLVNYNSKNFDADILKIIDLPEKKIIEKWNNKYEYRKKAIENYFSSNKEVDIFNVIKSASLHK